MNKHVLIMFFLIVSCSLLLSANTYQTKAQTPNVNITLYVGEYAFGLTPNNLISPGPTLSFTSGDTVNLTLINVGTMGHTWALTNEAKSDSTVLFNAAIATANNPLLANASSSVVFVVGSPGNYSYICRVPGHVALGMYGKVVVNGTIPEFGPALGFGTAVMVLTTTASCIALRKRQNKI